MISPAGKYESMDLKNSMSDVFSRSIAYTAGNSNMATITESMNRVLIIQSTPSFLAGDWQNLLSVEKGGIQRLINCSKKKVIF